MATIAIVGGGFCGVSVAIRILRSTALRHCKIVLINKDARFGRGVAYSTDSPYHLLNAPAGAMSAFDEAPADFVAFCKREDPRLDGSSYVPRSLYGDYIESRLHETEQRYGAFRLLRVQGSVQSVRDSGPHGTASVRLDDGREIAADHVVLAMGDAPRHASHPAMADIDRQSFYVDDPWRLRTRNANGAGVSLVLGTGLTAVDISLQLVKEHDADKVVLVSRRGLAPHWHAPAAPLASTPCAPTLSGLAHGSLVRNVRAIRALVRDQQSAGIDWRMTVSNVRRFVPELWADLTPRDRARFVRRLRPFWDIHRHRCAPATGRDFDELVRTGKIQIIRGELRRLLPTRDGVEATLRNSKLGEVHSMIVHRVINCAGAAGPDSLAPRSLLALLAKNGTVRFDSAGVGIETTDSYRVIGSSGRPANSIHYVGPLLRARHWEATAVPELRTHCTRVVAHLEREHLKRREIDEPAESEPLLQAYF